MAEFPNFRIKIKEESNSEEEEGECELVACSALLYGAVKEEPTSGLLNEAQDYENEEFPPEMNDAATAALGNSGFLQIVPGSVVSLANSTRVTTVISETQINMENSTGDGSIMVQAFQENDGHREYVVAYPPIPKCVIKEEPQTGDGQHEYASNQQLAIPSANTGSENLESLQQSFEAIPCIQILRSYSKRSRVTLSLNVAASDGTMIGKQTDIEEMEERNAEGIKEQQQDTSAHCDSSAISEQPSFEEVDSSHDVSFEDQHDRSCPIAGPSQRKQKANGNDIASGNSTLSKKKRKGKSLSLALSHAEEKERPYRCDICGRCYKEKHHLKRHLTGGECGIDVQFCCEQCGVHFTMKESLRRHLESVHKVERSQLAAFGAELIKSTKAGRPEEYPYKCSKCENVYKKKEPMIRHLKYECGVKPITCRDCNQQFKHNRTLKRHLLQIHKVDPSQLSSYGIEAFPSMYFSWEQKEKRLASLARVPPETTLIFMLDAESTKMHFHRRGL